MSVSQTTRRRQRRLLCGLAAVATLCGCGLQSSGVAGVVAAQGLGSGVQQVQGSTPQTGGGPTPVGSASPGTAPGQNPGGGLTGPGVVGGNASNPTGTAPGGTGTSPGANNGGSSTGSSTTGTSAGLHGTITLGYLAVTGFEDLAKYFNVHVGDYGDPNAQVAAMVAYVNSHGGIGGRRLVADVQSFNAQQSSSSTENSLCTGFAQDAHAFLVDLQGQIHPETRTCYQQNHVIAVEGSNYGFSQRFYDGLGGWDLQPYFPTYDEVEGALVSTLHARNWFGGDTKVGIVSWSDSDYQHIVHDVLEPKLRAAGVTSFVEEAVSNSDAGQMQSGVNQAVTAFETQGVKRVMFVGSAPLQPFFFIAADSQHQKFSYGMDTYDDMLYEQYNNQPGEGGDQLPGSLGVSVYPVDDVDDSQYAWPHTGQEAQCVAIYKAAGITFPARINSAYSSKQAMSYCEVTLLAKYVADHVTGPLTKASFLAEYQALGSGMQMASSYASDFTSGAYWGSSAYRVTQFDGSSGSWKLLSGNLAF